MRPRASSIVVFAAIALVVVLAGSVAVSAAFMPGCASCHMQGEFQTATESTAHSQVGCSSCHGGTTVASRVSFGTTQVFGMVLRVVPVDPSVASVSSGKCLDCHQQIDEGVVSAAGLNVLHRECGVGRECTECHSPTAHGAATSWARTSTMEMCYDCHGSSKATSKCDLCHAARFPDDRVQSGTFAATHGPNWQSTHGMGDMNTCGACHEDTKCGKCHGAGVPHPSDFVKKHPESSRRADAQCTDCHTSAFCYDCHGYEMPHPASFKPEHGGIVDKEGESGCKLCHGERDCIDCHVSHVHPTTLEQLDLLGAAASGAGER